MKTIYPNISLGYIGQYNQNQSLTSSFFHEIIQTKEEKFSKKIFFPQKIHKKDFFIELLQLETNSYEKHFLNLKEMLSNQFHNVLASKETSIALVNWFNLLLRYGFSEKIKKLSIDFVRDKNIKTELVLLQEIAKFQDSIDSNKVFDSCKLEELLKDSLSKSLTIEDRVEIMVLNYCIVFFCRFKVTIQKELIQNAAEKLILILDDNADDFNSIIRKSVAYRGIAMLNFLGVEKQSKYMQLTELYARDALANASSKIETILAKDNLLTCCQSLSKWYTFQKNFDKALCCLEEMVLLDPHDPTPYAEQGFFLLNQELPEKALKSFSTAADKGPPGVAMHIYFQAQCLFAIGNKDDAIKTLEKAKDLDPTAITPLLDLIQAYPQKHRYKAVELVERIFSNEVLAQQLEPGEIEELRKFMEVNSDV